MAKARGTLFINTIDYVCQRFGSGAHARVVQALPARVAAAVTVALREASWKPLDDLVAYMETARALWAPGDDAFYRESGRFAGRRDRQTRAVGVMIEAAETFTRMAPVLWHTFFDVGRLEVTERGERTAALRIHDFPTTRTLCERIAGSLEGQFECVAVESLCIARGDVVCELRLRWADPGEAT